MRRRRSAGLATIANAARSYEGDLLGEDEKAALEAEWRRDFEHGHEPDFTLTLGPGSF